MSITCGNCRSPVHPSTPVCMNCGQPQTGSGASVVDPPAGQGQPPAFVRLPSQSHAPAFVQRPASSESPAAGSIGVVAAKSPGLAVFLSIWLGGGQLYVGQIGLGIGLLVFHFFLLLLLFTGIGAILAVPLWLVSFALVATASSNAAKEFNRRNGIIVH
jgi:TM2 domain-containing membrane protein YozV